MMTSSRARSSGVWTYSPAAGGGAPVSERRMELVERKGVGHPDTICDSLVEAISVLSDAEGIAFCYFDEKDVVRHKLVQSIIKAYERWGKEAGR